MPFRKRGFDRKPKSSIAEDAYKDSSYQAPSKEAISHASETLQAKAFRDLENIGVIDVKADPNAELSHGSFPYTIIGRTCPVLDASYPGYVNIAGNSITELQNNTTSSQLMNVFDVAVVVKKLNYQYLPVRGWNEPGQNLAYCSEMIKSIEQAVSFGFSTMLTQLAFTQYVYTTDMPIPSQYVKTEAEAPMDRVLQKSAGYYAAMIHYQTVLQSLVQPISKYIELRSLEKELMRMSFRTEAPLVTQLFGLFKKSSFIAEVNTVGTVVINEYFDRNWYKQMNTLQCVPSRKTKGMVDPLVTMVATHAIPRLVIKSGANGIYDSDSLKTGASARLLNPETFYFDVGSLKLEQLIENACKLMNPAYILRYLRLLNHNALPGVPEGHTADDLCASISAYGEAVKIYLSYIARFAAAFSTAMSDIRTFLDKLSNSGLTYWEKGVAFFVNKIEQLDPHYNALLNDVFAAAYSGADKIIFDNQTKRWRAWSLWNKYTGIPEFDRVSGGSFLTFGLRNIQTTDSAGQSVNFNGSAGLIPILFTKNYSSSMIVTRLGASSNITARSITNSDLATNHFLTRLNVMSNTNLSVKAPVVEAFQADTTKRAHFCSAALVLLGNTFGYGFTKYNGSYTDTILDPDYVAFIDLEIEDVSNQMIVYARNYAPFRVDTPNPKRTMGFSSK